MPLLYMRSTYTCSQHRPWHNEDSRNRSSQIVTTSDMLELAKIAVSRSFIAQLSISHECHICLLSRLEGTRVGSPECGCGGLGAPFRQFLWEIQIQQEQYGRYGRLHRRQAGKRDGPWKHCIGRCCTPQEPDDIPEEAEQAFFSIRFRRRVCPYDLQCFSSSAVNFGQKHLQLEIQMQSLFV